MAGIRIIKIKGTRNKNNPRIAYFHKKNFDEGTTRIYDKYNVVVFGQKQYDDYWDNKEKAIRAQVRFHKG